MNVVYDLCNSFILKFINGEETWKVRIFQSIALGVIEYNEMKTKGIQTKVELVLFGNFVWV